MRKTLPPASASELEPIAERDRKAARTDEWADVNSEPELQVKRRFVSAVSPYGLANYGRYLHVNLLNAPRDYEISPVRQRPEFGWNAVPSLSSHDHGVERSRLRIRYR